MTELRQDPTTYDWVIMASARARRPDEFHQDQEAKQPQPEHSENCPFCPGNEHMTPEAYEVYDGSGKWRIRIVPNKFAALEPVGDTHREEWKIFRKMHGYGRHEVVVETPLHNQIIPFMDDGQVEELIQVYRDRYHALRRDPKIKIIIIFKNHGRGAGTSLEHPHTQIVASPIVPPYIRRKYQVATQYYDDTGIGLHQEVQRLELETGSRIVADTEYFMAFHPFASHYPFETWIMPKLHKSSFGNILAEEVSDLARVLKGILLKLYKSLKDPDYNFVIHTAPVDDEHKPYYLWHVQIIPRLTQVAGFELGSGIYINIAVPEETARFINSVKGKE